MTPYTKIDTSETKVFFTSDTHFGHNNILSFCKRPWDNVMDMNQALVDNWNSVVGENDIVYHLGDFAFASNSAWKYLLNCLNGKIRLVKGNHDDSRYPGHQTMDLFDSVSYQEYLRIDDQKVYLNHYPFLCFQGTYRGNDGIVYQLFGHVHTSPYTNKGKDYVRLQCLFPGQYDVGVDFNNFTPISWEKLNRKIRFQIENNVNMLYWLNHETGD